jgi:hypothetical protein
MVCNTPPYGHAPIYQISLTYLERQNVMARTRKYYLKNNYFTLRSMVKLQRRYKNMIQTLTKQKFEKQMETGDDSILASPST